MQNDETSKPEETVINSGPEETEKGSRSGEGDEADEADKTKEASRSENTDKTADPEEPTEGPEPEEPKEDSEPAKTGDDSETQEKGEATPDQGAGAAPAKTDEPPNAPYDCRRPRASTMAKRLVAMASLIPVLLAADLLAMVNSIERLDTPKPFTQSQSKTWVIIGSDDRSYQPDAGEGPSYMLGPRVGGQRADVVIAVRVDQNGVRALSIPRDLFLEPAPAYMPQRLTTLLNEGPAAVTSALCLDLGIPADHLVIVRLEGFVKLIDLIGGIDIEVPYPIRDENSGLDIAQSGRVHLDGRAALAFVRSRHAEQKIDGEWVQDDETTGASQRAASAGTVLSAAASKAASIRDPLVLHALAREAAKSTALDSRTSLFDLRDLTMLRGVNIPTLPVDTGDSELLFKTNDSTFNTLTKMGYQRGGCSMTGVEPPSTEPPPTESPALGNE
ncbi:MAG: LCP family protein [Micrococcales bacterium]|nr:LCP family protein [Micrococcales bacterium]